jgi:hypothetical protein
MPHENENHRNISHHGLKESQGFVRYVDHSNSPNDIGTLTPSALPAGLLPANGCLNPDPHPRAPGSSSGVPAAQRQRRNTYGTEDLVNRARKE